MKKCFRLVILIYLSSRFLRSYVFFVLLPNFWDFSGIMTLRCFGIMGRIGPQKIGQKSCDFWIWTKADVSFWPHLVTLAWLQSPRPCPPLPSPPWASRRRWRGSPRPWRGRWRCCRGAWGTPRARSGTGGRRGGERKRRRTEGSDGGYSHCQTWGESTL